MNKLLHYQMIGLCASSGGKPEYISSSKKGRTKKRRKKYKTRIKHSK